MPVWTGGWLKPCSDLISVLSCSCGFPPNASLWLVDRFPTIISATTCHIASILEVWTHLSHLQTWLVQPSCSSDFLPNASCWLANWVYAHFLCNYSSYCFHIGTVNSPYWVSQLIYSVWSCSSDFLLPETKSCPQCVGHCFTGCLFQY